MPVKRAHPDSTNLFLEAFIIFLHTDRHVERTVLLLKRVAKASMLKTALPIRPENESDVGPIYKTVTIGIRNGTDGFARILPKAAPDH